MEDVHTDDFEDRIEAQSRRCEPLPKLEKEFAFINTGEFQKSAQNHHDDFCRLFSPVDSYLRRENHFQGIKIK